MLLLAAAASLAYGVAPLIYRPSLQCTPTAKVQWTFAWFALASGLLLPARHSVEGALYGLVAGLVGGVAGSYMYLTAVKVGGAAVANVSSSAYVVMLPLAGGRLDLLPSAALVAAGVALAARSPREGGRGALYGLAAAAAWTLSIVLLAEAVELAGPGGAQVSRSAALLAALAPAARRPHCRAARMLAGGFLDSFVGFSAYTLAVSGGHYVAASIVTASYPLVTALAERPATAGRLLGAGLAFAGAALTYIRAGSTP